MQLSNIIIVFLLVVVIWNSHLAGAAYTRVKKDTNLTNFAIGRSFISVVIGALIVFLSWK
jgi:hypothetical protein